MREDMFKVIVERPRLVNSNGYSRDGRKFRNDENAPGRLGMKRGYTQWPKSLNENLAPLKRYLEKQVNRPWDKVYSEIRATIDARSTVKHHILQHIEDFVAIDTRWVDTADGGQVVIRRRWPRKDTLLEDANIELFVHPRTGILLRNRHRKPWNWSKSPPARTGRPPLERRVVDETEQLMCIEGIWYRVTLAKLPAGVQHETSVDGTPRIATTYRKCWDAVRNCEVSWIQPGESPNNADYWFGRRNVYATSKRQLSSRELKQYGLQQKGRGDSRPFCFGPLLSGYMLDVRKR